MTDKKSCDHAIGIEGIYLGGSHLLYFSEKNQQGMTGVFEPFDFCPLCGQPLKQTKFDRVILKAAGLDSELELFPTQSLWDAAKVLKQAKFRKDKDCLSVDLETFPDSNREVFMLGISGLWWAQSRQELKETTLVKVLLWALTELTVEDIEKLFDQKA